MGERPTTLPLMATGQRPDFTRSGSTIPHRPPDASVEAGRRRALIGPLLGQCENGGDYRAAGETISIRKPHDRRLRVHRIALHFSDYGPSIR